MHSKINILQLIRTPGIGLKTFEYLTKSFANIHDAILHIETNTNKKIISKDIILNEINQLQNKFNGNIITYQDPQYPKALKLMNDFPPALSCIGNIELLKQKNIAIVGSRRASLPFLNFTYELSHNLIKYESVNIVSGLAVGIDTYAHKGAFKNNIANTIVVLPHGISNQVYPSQNLKLYQDIINSNGLIISEFPLQTPPGTTSFHQRNRIIAGLSQGVIIVQASKKSGSLMTGKYALDYNRQIFAVPGAPMSPLSEGTNELINNGAQIITSASDTGAILHNLTNLNNQNNSSLLQSTQTISISNTDKNNILNVLSYEIPITIDEIVQHLSLPVSTVRIVLVELSMANKAIILENDSALRI
ncbi:MAG: DNA-processing protein DprA [Pseudomonadota bacterium]